MDELVLYINEHSLPSGSVTPGELQQWSDASKLWIEALRLVGKHHPKYRLFFPVGWLDSVFAGKTLRIWIKQWIGTDEYRRLQTKMRSLHLPGDLLQEVYLGENRAVGLTFAHIQETWACSFPVASSDWLTHLIEAKELSVDMYGQLLESNCAIEHISCVGHVDYWSQSLTDWGQRVSSTSRIGVVDGHSVLMYSAPSEHGIPHVHVVDGAEQHTIAKYRIEPFELMEGSSTLDAVMRNWVTLHKTTLLNSWNRCMRGGHPYVIAHES